MSEVRSAETTATAGDAAVEPLRVLFPTSIGDLAVDILGEAITKVVIDPPKKERKGYVSFDQVEGSDYLDEVFGRLSEYFAGARKKLDLKYNLRPSGIQGFARRILKEAGRIPYGRTRTYRQIADKAGQPDAYRVVLATLVANPLPIVIPCHRVVTNKSGIGSYVAGSDTKRWLITMERQALAEDNAV